MLLFLAPAFAAGQARSTESLPESIPIFPLPEASLFPNSTQPFHIFEPRYRAMIADALAGDSIIGMVTLQPGFESDYDPRAVSRELARAKPAFAGIELESLSDLGAPLAGSSAGPGS